MTGHPSLIINRYKHRTTVLKTIVLYRLYLHKEVLVLIAQSAVCRYTRSCPDQDLDAPMVQRTV